MKLLARLAPWLACLGLGLYILVLSARLSAERDFRSSVQHQLHAPDNSRPTLSAYLTAALETSANRAIALNTIDLEANEAKKLSDAKDAELVRAQEENVRRFQAVQSQLTQLTNRKSVGDPALDCAAINEDSKAPWKGWHQ